MKKAITLLFFSVLFIIGLCTSAAAEGETELFSFDSEQDWIEHEIRMAEKIMLEKYNVSSIPELPQDCVIELLEHVDEIKASHADYYGMESGVPQSVTVPVTTGQILITMDSVTSGLRMDTQELL